MGIILILAAVSLHETMGASPSFCPLIWDSGGVPAVAAISARGDYIAFGYNAGLAYYNLSGAAPIWVRNDATSWIFEVSISTNGHYLTIGGTRVLMVQLFGNTGNAPLWSFKPPRFPTAQEASYWQGYLSTAISGDGRYLAAYAYWPQRQDTLYLFNTSSSVPLWSYDMALPSAFAYPRVQISQDGGRLAIFNPSTDTLSFFSEHDNSTVWTTRFSDITADPNVHRPTIRMSATGDYVAAAFGNYVQIFGSASNTTLTTLQVVGPLEELDMSQDATTIAVVDNTGWLRAYDFPTGALLFASAGLREPGLALDQNGSRIVSAGSGTVYDRSGRSICTLLAPSGPVAMSANGRIVTGRSVLYAIASSPPPSSGLGFIAIWIMLATSVLGVYTVVLGFSWVRWRALERQSKRGRSTQRVNP
jgi:hypothetical protein